MYWICKSSAMQHHEKNQPVILQILSPWGELSPSVLILRAVRTKANKVALNITVPSLLRGMFMATSRCRPIQTADKCWRMNIKLLSDSFYCVKKLWKLTLQATLWGQSFPKPNGGWILLSRVTTSRCFILPLAAMHHQIKHYTTDTTVFTCFREVTNKLDGQRDVLVFGFVAILKKMDNVKEFLVLTWPQDHTQTRSF